jgi:hypothetical protein
MKIEELAVDVDVVVMHACIAVCTIHMASLSLLCGCDGILSLSGPGGNNTVCVSWSFLPTAQKSGIDHTLPVPLSSLFAVGQVAA